LSSGVKNIVSIQCEDKFCRYKEGTKINTRRLQLSKNVLKQLGFDENVLKVVKYSRKAVYKTEECVGCDKCVFICPYNAIKAEPFSTPRIVYEDCVGCGACALVCPHKAIEVKGFEFDNVLQRYCQAAKAMKTRNGQPAVLVFSCQWSEFSALDNPNNVLGGKNALILEVPCFKGMDPVHVVNALQCGFDGVMGVVCAAEDCKLSEGRDTAERNMIVLKDALKKKGLLNRFELFELSPRCEGEFKTKFESFYQKISALPEQAVAKMEAH
jgi:coenzyme F420-reducing hydrogenase delta subunit